MKISRLLVLLAFFPLISRAFTPPADLPEARELCTRADLRPIEGLWSYPGDDVTVMVYRSRTKGLYDIYVVEAADCSLAPGMKIGELRASAVPDTFSLNLFTRLEKGVLGMPCEVTATFSENKESLTIKKPSVKIRLNPGRLLPYFWRIVSVSVKPGEALPEGMIKIYPSYDGNDSSKREPRYL